MAERYCTNCGNELGPNGAFCANCGKPTNQTAAVATPEADVNVPPLPRNGVGSTQGSSDRRGLKRVVKVSRLDKIVGLIVGAALLLAVLWFLFQFFAGSLSGFFGAF